MAKPWSEVEKSDDYQLLSPEDKISAKQEYWNNVVSKKESFSSLSKEDKQSAQNEFLGGIKPEKNKVDLLTPSALALGGAGAIGAGKWMLQPAVDLYGVNKEAGKLKRELGIHRNVGIGDIPKQIGLLRQEKITPIKDRITNVKLASQKAVLNAKNQLNQFDNAIVNNSIDEVAQVIKSGSRDWLNSGYSSYGTGIKDCAELLKDSGVEITTQTYLSKVIEPVLENARNAGIPEEKLQYLINVKNKLTKQYQVRARNLGKAEFNLTKSAPDVINLQQAKGYIDNVDNFRLKHSLVDKFGNMLEELAPEGSVVKITISDLNSAYKPFKEVSNSIYKMIDPNTGVFDDTKITKWYKDYIKTAQDTSKQNVLRMLGEETKGVTPIGGLSPLVKNLENIKTQRQGLVQAIPQLTAQKVNQLEDLGSQLQKEVSRYAKLSQKAEELASRAKGAKGKLLGRAITAGVLGGRSMISNFLKLPLSGKVTSALPIAQTATMIPQAYEAWKMRNEPLQQLQAFTGQPQVPPMARTQQINQDLAQNPQTYKNSIMTPQTANYLAMREKILMKKDKNYKSKIIEVFKRRGIIPAIQQLLAETEYVD